MILTPNQPGCMVSPVTAFFMNRHANLAALRVKALNPNLNPRIAQELLDLRQVALMYDEPPLPEAEAGSAEAARELNQWLTPTWVAGQLGLTDRAVRLACTTGRIEAQKVGDRWRISRQSYENYRAARAAA